MFEFTTPTESVPQLPRWLAASIAAHGLAILLLFAIRFSNVVSTFPLTPQHFTLIAPPRETPVVARTIRVPHPREFRPPLPTHASLTLPAAPLIPAPAIEIPKPALPELPPMTVPLAASIPVIKPSGFNETKPAAPVPAPKPAIKASGFESADNPVRGPARATLSALGSFDSAHSTEGAPVRSAIARPGEFSDASSASSTSIGNTAHRSLVSSAAFGDTTVERGAVVSRQAAAAARFTPVEIISKPNPAFTAEARTKKIEGEVLLEVQFNASGAVRVLRIARGLGHGLDETAAAAAEGIRFRPATRDGAAIDSTALVHIVFQLAN